MYRSILRRRFREAGALFLQAYYLSYDLKPTSRKQYGPTVVLLHGLYASAGVLRPLRRRIEQDLQASTYSLTYPPGPGIEALAERVAALVAAIESDAPIHLVGHSLGGLALRYFARQGLDRRVVQTISLASPYRGTPRAHLVPGQACRDLTPGAPILKKLMRRQPEDDGLPHLALVAAEDEMILPDAYPEYGEHVVVPQVGHNGILFSRDVADRVVRQIARVSARAPLASPE